MRDIAQRRHKRVTLIARSFIIAGLAKLVGLPLFVWALLEEAASLAADPQALPISPEWLACAVRFVVGHIPFFLAFWMLIGLFMILAAVNLGRRRSWAWAGLEIVCWFGLVEAPLVAAFICFVRQMLLRPGVTGGAPLAAALVSRFWASLAWLGIYAILLILLKGTSQGDSNDGQAEGQS